MTKQPQLFIIDWDGTFFSGIKPKRGSKELFNYIINNTNGDIIFLTNNSSRSRREYIDILTKNQLWDKKRCEVITSGVITINYLQNVLKVDNAFIMGTKSLIAEFKKSGIRNTPFTSEAVVVGFDLTLTYPKLQNAHRLIKKGVGFIATHDDIICPLIKNSMIDCGSIIESLKKSTGKSPLIIGKPHKATVNYFKNILKAYNKHTAYMIGDNIDTDGELSTSLGIKFINVNKLKTLAKIVSLIK